MNKLNVYHCDIKDANVLVQINETMLKTRLIDWGLSFLYNKKHNGIPRKLYRRPFQFNVPFSSILGIKVVNLSTSKSAPDLATISEGGIIIFPASGCKK